MAKHLKPLVRARRSPALVQRAGVSLSRALEEELFRTAEVLSEGSRRTNAGQRDSYFGSTMISIDLDRLRPLFRGGLDGRARERRFLPAAPPPDEPKGTRDPLGDVYTMRDAAKVFGLSASRLRYWERSGFIVRSVQQGRLRFYSFEDLIGIRAAKELLDEGVPLQSVRRSVESLRSSLPQGSRPLSALRIVAEGQTLLVRDDRGTYESSTGQLRLDFEVSELRDDVVRVLRRSERQNHFAQAYQHYLEGCRFDETENTFDRAEAAYRKAIELDPSLANALTNLGNLMYRRSRLKDAENFYVRALQIDPEQPEAFYNLGFLLYDRGEIQAAVLNFRRAVRSDPVINSPDPAELVPVEG